MVEKKTLEQVLQELKDAEKEYKEKCLKYGITEKHKRKKLEEGEPNQDEEGQSEDNNQDIKEENNETASEN